MIDKPAMRWHILMKIPSDPYALGFLCHNQPPRTDREICWLLACRVA